MKARGLVLFVMISLTVRVSLAQFIRFPTDPLLPNEQAMVDAPTVKIKCVNLDILDKGVKLKEQDQRLTMVDVASCDSRSNFVLEKDFNTIYREGLKPNCPTKVSLKSPELHPKGSTIEMYPDLANRPDEIRSKNIFMFEEDPYQIILKASCYFTTKDGRRIDVKNYYRKCRMTDLKESGTSVIELWREKRMNFENLSDCFNNEKHEMSSSEIFKAKNTPPSKAAKPGGPK